MIELGKYFSTFYVTKGEVKRTEGYIYNKDADYSKFDRVDFKGFHCVISSINEDTLGLQLMTTFQDLCIPIVC